MIKRVWFYGLIALVQTLVINTSYGQYLWRFEKTGSDVLKETNGKVPLHLTSNWDQAELVTGVKGTALRTDGYSTWLTATLPEAIGNPVSMGGWFALESYPTDTAGFFVLADSKNGFSISACVDRFGKPLIGVKRNEQMQYYGADTILQKFKWIHVGINIQKDKAALFINGTQQATVTVDAKNHLSFDRIIIGRDIREKSIGIFPVTAINGIIDEIEVSNKPLQIRRILNGMNSASALVPRLAIPPGRFQHDFNRPKYHLLPAANWTNETHGLIYYKGEYHIFNQKNASNLFLGQINWGHFSSPDLITWTEHKPALTPEPGYDENGIWSGHIVLNNEGVPTIIYTAGGTPMGIGIAFPKDSTLIDWVKYKGNPVIKGQPEGFSRTDLRDPYVFKEGNKWYMIVGFGIKEKETEKGAVLLYTSNDLKKWTFLHTLFEGDPHKDDSGIFWEMPVFVKLNGKYILLVNKVPYKGIPAVALYWTGDFVNEKFIPDNKMPQRLEVVNRLLSPSVALDKDGLTTAIAIIPDEIGSRAAYQNGWTHLYSIPRVWTLENGKINQQPHPALQKLRLSKATIPAQTVYPDKNVLLSKGTHQVEIEAEFSPLACKRFGFIVGKDSAGTELTKIYYDFEKQQFIVDQTKSSQRKYIPLNTRTGQYVLDSKSNVNLHLFMDGSVIEVFINNKDAFTTRLFPKNENSNWVEVFTEGCPVQLNQASVWKLSSSHNKVDF